MDRSDLIFVDVKAHENLVAYVGAVSPSVPVLVITYDPNLLQHYTRVDRGAGVPRSVVDLKNAGAAYVVRIGRKVQFKGTGPANMREAAAVEASRIDDIGRLLDEHFVQRLGGGVPAASIHGRTANTRVSLSLM